MIGSSSPRRFANTTADVGMRPVASDTLTPRRTASPMAATSRSDSCMSWPTSVPSMSRASIRTGNAGAGRVRGRWSLTGAPSR